MHCPARSLPRMIRTLVRITFLAMSVALAGCTESGQESGDGSSHLERANTYLQQGQYRPALVEVRSAIQAEPNQLEFRLKLAELYLDIGAPREASGHLAPLLENEPQQVALPLTRAYLAQNKRLSAQETLARFEPTNPQERQQATLLQAELQRRGKDPESALAIFKGVLVQQPDNQDAITGVLRSLLDLKRPAEVRQAAEQWMQLQGVEPAIQYWQSVALYQQNQLQSATQILTEAVSQLPTTDIMRPLRRDILTLLTRTLTEQGNIVEAQVYRNLLAERQNQALNQQSQATIEALKAGDIDEAKRLLRDILALSPEHREASLMLGALSADTGELDTGQQLLLEHIDPEVSPTPFLRSAAQLQLRIGQRETALAMLARAREARPSDTELDAMYGLVALSLKQHRHAGVAVLKQVLTEQPGRSRLRLALAQHALADARPGNALTHLKAIVAAEPESSQARQLAGRLLFTATHQAIAETNWPLARQLAEEAAKALPEQPEVALLPAAINRAQGALDRALEQIASAEERLGASVLTRLARASVLENRDGVPAAFDYLNRQWQQHNEQALMPPLLRLARLQGPDIQGQVTRAWVEHSSQNIAARLARAEWLMAAGRGQEAIPHYEAALALSPDQVTALNNLAWLLQDPAPGRALAMAERAATLAPENAPVLDTYGWLLHRQGKQQRAIETLEKALQLAPDNADIAAHLAAARAGL